MKKKGMEDPMKKRTEGESHWKDVHGAARIRYLFDYYKFPLVLIGIVIYTIIWGFGRNASRQDYGLYLGLVNVVASDDLSAQLEKGLSAQTAPEEEKSSPSAVFLYRNLFLTTNTQSEYHQYTYATRMKILAAINAEQMDLVLMDREAFDAFSQNGYLTDLSALLSGLEEEADLMPMLVKNIYIEEDNSTDMLLGTADRYEAVTKEGMYGLDLSRASALISSAGFSGTVYLGIVENSPRKEAAVRYLRYLTA